MKKIWWNNFWYLYPDINFVIDGTKILKTICMGLSAIIARHGIKPEETMAFGDGGNDISIIKKAGIGIAMGNATEPLKNAADN